MAPDLTIASVDVTPVDIPLTDEFVISRGRISVAENAFVSVRLRCGVVGHGEIAPFAALTGETRDASVAAARALSPVVVGRNPVDYAEVSVTMREASPRAPAARAGIECAMVDALARAEGKPLWKVWGASAVETYETDITLPILEEDRLVELSDMWYARGFRTFKLKVGTGVAQDTRRVRRLAARHSDVRFVLDANQGFDRDEAASFLSDLGELAARVTLFEQPLARDDIDGMAELRNGSSVLIAADESVCTLADAHRVILAGAADVINLKIMKSGLVETLAIARAATESGVGLMIGGMVETRLAMSFSLAIALGFGGITHFDLDTPLLLGHDPIRGGFQYEGPAMRPWHDAGVGAAPAPARGGENV